jgi:ribonucleoside-diphosphate reductase beta chain
MLNMLPKLAEEKIHGILKEAVDLEIAFVKAALPKNLTGINAAQMIEYVQHCADRLLSMVNADYKPLFPGVNQPLQFMNMISIDSKTNFFEKRVSEYVMAGTTGDRGFDLDADF